MAAPTLNITKHQATTTQPSQPVRLSLGMASSVPVAASAWTQSTTDTKEYYYTGGHASLSSNTMYDVRCVIEGAKARSGTLGSLDTYGFAVGDNDSLGYDTVYVRMSDDLAPGDWEVDIVWDESTTGDGEHRGKSEAQWFLDLDDAPTAAAVAGWEDRYRYVTDPRTGETIDLVGRNPADGRMSPLVGWFFEWCLPAGTFSIKCTVVNSDGESTTATQSVTVAADTRTERTVNSGGGADHTTIAAAIAASSANDRILVEGGHAETLSGTLVVDNSGTLIEWDGQGVQPEITSNDRIISVNDTEFVTLTGLKFTPSGTAFPAVRMLRSNDLAVIGCDFGGTTGNRWSLCIDSSFNNQSTEFAGLLFQNNSVDLVQSYVVGGGSVNRAAAKEYLILGNDLDGDGTGPSIGESTLRDAATYNNWSVLYNALSEDDKDALRVTNMDTGVVEGNYFRNGVLRTGTSGSVLHKPKNIRITRNRFFNDTNTSELSMISVDEGADGIFIASNVFDTSNPDTAGFALSGDVDPGVGSSPYVGYQGNFDVSFFNNTSRILAGRGDESTFRTTGQTTDTYVTGCEISNNVVTTFAGYAGTAIDNTNTPWTASSNDVGEGTLEDNFVVTGITITDNTVKPGLLYDYYGWPRQSTTSNGAVEPPPTLAADTPADNATGVAVDLSQVTLVANENLTLTGATGEFYIYTNGSLAETVQPADAALDALDKTMVTIPISVTLGAGKSVSIRWSQDAARGATSKVGVEANTSNTLVSFTTAGGNSGVRSFGGDVRRLRVR